ncbi:3-oxoadipate enol-lactonase [Amorphus suaedae]
MPTAHYDGTDVSYRVDGSGPGLVLVHGTGGNGELNFGQLVPRLAQRFTVVRPDYSGSGETADPGGALTTGRLAADVMAAADAAGLERFDIAGFSLGAPVAIELAARHPERVRRMVLLAGFARADDARMQLQFRLWRDLASRDPGLQTRLQWLTGYSPAFVAGLAPEAVEEAIATAVRIRRWDGFVRQVELDLVLDVREAARAIRCPTLSIGCRLDHIVPPAHARELVDLIPGARYAEIESGHVAPVEQPDAVLELLEAFLDG